MQAHKLYPGSVSSQSTQTSSVFSAEEEDYDSRIKEIEAYYMRTLLAEDGDGDGGAGAGASAESPTKSTAAQAKPAPGAWASGVWNQTALVSPATAGTASGAGRALEVEINPQYMPATGVMPLTSENLKLLQNPKLAPHKLECVAEKPARKQQSSRKPGEQPAQQQGQPHEKCNKVLYKTELCESFSTKGSCKYGHNCQFAHGLQELKFKERNNKFRTKPCVNWMRTGSCPYGQRCCFKHGSDQDIKVYLQAGHIPRGRDTEPARRNMHADVQALQKMAW